MAAPDDFDGECKHGLAVGTCAVCKSTNTVDGRAAALRFEVLRTAVTDLGAGGAEFMTTDVAAHSVVREAHVDLLDDPQFRQLVGIRLSAEQGRLGLRRTSEVGVTPARWQLALSGLS